ncbi:MAG: PepSY domain-containing protein [Lachnospiraceae bacterium]|nr:PepSY domain-containing protein [Lachnospiraceae bacterium]
MRKQGNHDRHKWNSWILGAVVTCMAAVMVCMGSTTASAKAISSLEQAKKLAQQKVKSATVTKVEADMDNGVAVYEVSLRKGSKEYDLKYRKSDGKLLEYSWELQNVGYGTQSTSHIYSKAEIKKKALKKVKKASVRAVQLKSDDGRMEYKVLLQKGSYRYTLVYDAKKAKLMEYEQEYTGSKAKATTAKEISMNKAKQIALKKVPGAAVVKIERDQENGTVVYEVELRKGNYEYEMVIDAKTGKILHTEKEYDD